MGFKTEVIMKKIAFIVSLLLTVFFVSNTVLAVTDSEYAKALKYYNSKKYKEAVRIFKVYVEKKPEPSAYYRIGYGLYELRKFDEANEYFKQAYLIDPNYSPELVAPAGISPKEAARIARKHIPAKKKQPVPAATKEQTETKPEPKTEPAPAPEKKAIDVPQPQKPQESAVTPGKAVQPEPPKVEPRPTPSFPAPSALPAFPVPKGAMPGAAPEMLAGLMAGFGMIFLVLGIAFYLFFCLCLFIIAKKLNVPSPWIAFVPIVQIWTFVVCAGKPWWWILLLLIPFVNIILIIYLYMCIAENVGKSKWLGLMVLIPYLGALILLGLLAFSRTEKPGGSIESRIPA